MKRIQQMLVVVMMVFSVMVTLGGMMHYKAMEVDAREDFQIKDDWYLNSPRSHEVPQAIWPFMSTYGESNKLVVEPIFLLDKVVSGYTEPNKEVTIHHESYTFDGDIDENAYTTSDSRGYFTTELSRVSPQSKINVWVDGVDQTSQMFVYQYKPTPLAHPSGNLTLERFFMGQDYIEGHTFPNTEISIAPANGYGTSSFAIGQSDATGYFKIKNNSVITKEKRIQMKVLVTNPDTEELLEVVPYTWTEDEFARVKW